MSWSLEITKMLAPVLPAFLAGYLVNRWKSREDMVERHCEEMCKSLELMVEFGIEYWSADQILINPLLSTKITALQFKLSEMRKALEGSISHGSSSEIVEAEVRFQRLITGGNFGVHNRTADIERTRMLMVEARRYESIIRAARLKDARGIKRR